MAEIKKRGRPTKPKEVEEWRDIVGYEGLYQISNLGQVKRLCATRKCGSWTRIYREKILSPYKNNNGYCMIDLVNADGVRNKNTVHRLVALTFLPTIGHKEDVNHIDCDKENNSASNLEWCTAKQNIRHAYDNGLMAKSITQARKNIRKTPRGGGWSVVQLSLDGSVLKTFSTITRAGKETGIGRHNIGKCCRGQRTNAGGYGWRYA